MEATRALATFTRELRFEDIPESARTACAHLVLDTVGSALAAWDAPGVRELRSLMGEWSQGESPVWVTGERLSPAAATLVNSAMSHAYEYDDLHRELPLHAGTIVVPAALAVAGVRPETTGAELTVAIVAGTEILARIARATGSYRGKAGFRGWNPTSVVAGFGAAAIAGRLLGLDADQITRAMGLSYAQASGNQQCIADGGLVKRMQPGLVAEAGVRAAYLAKAGISGAIEALEGRNGYFRVYEQGDYDPSALTQNLGKNFEIERLAFKRYPVCGMAHPAIDSLREMLQKTGFSREEISTVSVEGSKFVVDMVGRPYNPGPHPEVDAQFNLAYCLASVMETGTIGLADLTPDRTLDTKRRLRAHEIAVTLDPALEGKWTSRVRIRNHAGAEISRVRSDAASQNESPLTPSELVAKFNEAAAVSGAFDDARASHLAELLVDVPRLPSLLPLIDALTPGSAGGARQ